MQQARADSRNVHRSMKLLTFLLQGGTKQPETSGRAIGHFRFDIDAHAQPLGCNAKHHCRAVIYFYEYFEKMRVI